MPTINGRTNERQGIHHTCGIIVLHIHMYYVLCVMFDICKCCLMTRSYCYRRTLRSRILLLVVVFLPVRLLLAMLCAPIAFVDPSYYDFFQRGFLLNIRHIEKWACAYLLTNFPFKHPVDDAGKRRRNIIGYLLKYT